MINTITMLLHLLKKEGMQINMEFCENNTKILLNKPRVLFFYLKKLFLK